MSTVSAPASIPIQPTTKKRANATNIWLSAFNDPLASLQTTQSCIRLSDVVADGDYKLLIADQNEKKLKLFKGTQIISEHVLLETPASVACFYTDLNKPQTPSIAVAASSFIFIYRNLRPYYKFTLPPLPVHDSEKQLWDALKQGQFSGKESLFVQKLFELKEDGVELTSRSLTVLTLSPLQLSPYLSTHASQPLIQQSIITCMETLHKTSIADRSISQLVVGTESRLLFIMDPSGTAIQHQFMLQDVPVAIVVVGVYDIDYRLFITLRNNTIVQVKKHKLLITVIQVPSVIVAHCVIDKNLYVATYDTYIAVYNFKGKHLYSITLNPSLTTLNLVTITSLGVLNQRKLNNTVGAALLIVCLSNGEIRLYNGRICVNIVSVQNSTTASSQQQCAVNVAALTCSPSAAAVIGLRFGPYGREENSLITVTANGSLSIRMLSLRADFDFSSTLQSTQPPVEQDIPLPIPKKTRLYVEQSARERENASMMHRQFQRDLCRFRLKTVQAFIKLQRQGGSMLGVTGQGESVRIDVKVYGLGPRFKIRTTLKNTSSKPIASLIMTLCYNTQVYRLDSAAAVPIALLVPFADYVVEQFIVCEDVQRVGEQLRVFVVEQHSVIPIISALVNMPQVEPMLE